MTTHQQLLQAVADLEDNGLIVPCREPAVRDYWTSEHAAELEAAAHRCGTCPLISQCREYSTAADEPEGVWGGLTAADRRAAKRTKLKETPA